MLVSVHYKPKAGKSGKEMNQQFHDYVDVLQTCHSCIKIATLNDNILEEEAATTSKSICNENCLSRV